MIVEKIVVGALATNCYIIAPGANSEAAVIDPGDDADEIDRRLQQLNLELKLIVNTHGHYDHIGADSELARKKKIPIYIHPEDMNMLNDPAANLSLLWGGQFETVENVKELVDGQVLEVGELELKCIHTPGHTAGSISVLVQGKLFTGDLLFNGSVGRTDFPGSSYEALLRSLQRIAVLSEDTLIYPGHGPSTILGEEKANNPFFKDMESL